MPQLGTAAVGSPTIPSTMVVRPASTLLQILRTLGRVYFAPLRGGRLRPPDTPDLQEPRRSALPGRGAQNQVDAPMTFARSPLQTR